MTFPTARALLIAAVLTGAAMVAPRHLSGQASSTPLSAGAFSEAQSARGEVLYLDECGSCHGSTLRGVGEFGGPGLLGERFLSNWRGKTLAELFERTRTTMPQDSPGRLREQEYADIIAFLLKANNYPSGDRDLTPASGKLKEVTIEDPPAAK